MRLFGITAWIIIAFALSLDAQSRSPRPTRPAISQPYALHTFTQGREITTLPAILKQRDRSEAVNRMLRDRLDNLLPALMREAGIDLWLIINREYAEDPVYLTLVPEPVFAARRTTMLVIHDRGPEKGVERLTISRYGLQGLYQPAWDGGSDAEQWKRLAAVIAERNPKTIAIDTSRHWAFGDGLTAGLRDQLMEVLTTDLRSRIVSAESLAIRWLETRTAMELEVYPQIVALARGVIAEAFSNRVITPGVTTTDDVAWYIRQRYAELDLPVWFMPYVNIQRRGKTYEPDTSFFGESGIIQRGDVLHTDVGISYLRLNTDTQEMGYVLRPGEENVPVGLVIALEKGNRWQDLLVRELVSGRTGNEILAAARSAAEREGIVATIYTHPLGFFGHGPGPTIGMWDNQGPTPIRGDWKLHPSTAYAIEGDVKVKIPEWDDQMVQIKLEQSAVFDGSKLWYLAGRQTKWHVIR
ncbi:MAG TPA: M24 family metallopeptidase [Thermoanaerobaculia bacterium]|nr:M24 family metallopeptidase [Thermoanaerobaculia bacterium]